MSPERRVGIVHESDIVEARREGRALAEEVGFSRGELALIATAISELARNILSYARTGEIVVRLVERDGRRGVTVVASDEGPGIADVEACLRDGYSTSGGLGLGLPGARRLMDEMDIDTAPGAGTRVVMTKWAR